MKFICVKRCEILSDQFLKCTGRRSWGGEGDASPYDRSGGMACTIIPPPYKGDEQMKSIRHDTQIITPEEIVSYIDDEIIFSRKFE